MKPRQTIKNFHNSSLASLYQNTVSQQSLQSQQAPLLRDIDLAKLGLLNPHPDVALPNLQAPPPTTTIQPTPANQEELVKAIQAIYGKTSTDILQKALGDWPQQSVSPPDFPRTSTSSTAISFNNNVHVNNNANSYPGHSRQDISQFSSNNHHHLSQTPSNINNYRMSTQSLHSPQQQHSSHRKSVLSLHQHHQNDSNNRRLKQHHHHMSTTNTSFTNHNTATACIATSTSAQLSDTINSSTLGGGVAGSSGIGGGCRMSGPAAAAANILDPISSIDNMFYDNSMQIDSDISPSNQQRSSMRKHQQLQKLLKASSSQIINTPPSPSTTLPAHRNDTHIQRNINSGNNNMSQTQNVPMSTCLSTISPPQTGFGTVPKSLLNLAACTSNTPTSSGSSCLPPAKFSSMVSQLRSARNSNHHQSQVNLNINNNNTIDGIGASINSVNRTPVRGNSGNINDVSSDAIEGVEQSSLLQHIKSNAPLSNNNAASTSRPQMKQLQWSTILSEDQTFSSNRNNNVKLISNPNTNSSAKTQVSHVSKPSPGASSKEAFLATIQERAARAGVSIGEISRSNQSSTSLLSVSGPPYNSPSPSDSNLIVQSNVESNSPHQSKGDYCDLIDKKEIESALSRVGARNDLSLLYPPMLLASNSQKQINALSAGLQSNEESELFTKEVKRIIHKECNIIYECKECSNLFRSLANLVKHKRTYCTEHSNRNSVEVNKRSSANPMMASSSREPPLSATATTCDAPRRVNLEQSSQAESRNIDEDVIARKSEKRPAAIANDPRTMRTTTRNLERRNNLEREELHQNRAQTQALIRSNTPQSSLSKILQSQPKGRLPVARDSALLGSLKMSSSTNLMALNNAIEDANNSINSDQVDEQLVRNSSLAQTLLNEKLARGETLDSRSSKRLVPKRKLLEDCIQKVKRDKLLTDDEEQVNSSSHEDRHKPALAKGEHLEPCPDDSDSDSDMLTIDLDEPKGKQKKNKRRESALGGGSSSNSSTSSATSTSVVKLNPSSSALLKALTRPVDAKRPITSANQSISSESRQGQSVSGPSNKQDSAASKEDTFASSLADLETDPVSPLFDKFTCDICESDHADSNALMEHTIECHVDMKMVYPCIFCSLSFVALENVCRHILDIHKKAKAHVNRLKDVVRSRSHLSADFQACSDYPPRFSDSSRHLESGMGKAISSDWATAAELYQHQHKAGHQQLNLDGMLTRGKKRVDYNSMLNSRDTLESSAYCTRTRTARSQSADQTISEGPHKEEHEKAASIDGGSLVIGDHCPRSVGRNSKKRENHNGDHMPCQNGMNKKNSNHDSIDCDLLEDKSSDVESDIGGEDRNDTNRLRSGDVFKGRKLPINYQEDAHNDQNSYSGYGEYSLLGPGATFELPCLRVRSAQI